MPRGSLLTPAHHMHSPYITPHPVSHATECASWNVPRTDRGGKTVCFCKHSCITWHAVLYTAGPNKQEQLTLLTVIVI